MHVYTDDRVKGRGWGGLEVRIETDYLDNYWSSSIFRAYKKKKKEKKKERDLLKKELLQFVAFTSRCNENFCNFDDTFAIVFERKLLMDERGVKEEKQNAREIGKEKSNKSFVMQNLLFYEVTRRRNK